VRDVWQFLSKLLLLHRNVDVEALVVLKKCRMKKIYVAVEQLQVIYSMCVALQITAP